MPDNTRRSWIGMGTTTSRVRVPVSEEMLRINGEKIRSYILRHGEPFDSIVHDDADTRREPYAITIRPSSVSGSGAFAQEAIPRDVYLGVYQGLILSRRDLQKLEERWGFNSSTLLQVLMDDLTPTQRVKVCDHTSVQRSDTSFYVESLYKSHWSRFINDARNTRHAYNVRFTKTGRIKTIDDIPAGAELFIDYGPEFWKPSLSKASV